MRKICLVILLLALCHAFGVSALGAGEIKGPLMVMEERSFDFKEVREGEIIEHAFRVFNRGEKNLAIQRVQPD